jgi:hypothetical protein
MDFVSEDNSYRSTAELENLVTALQAEVARTTGYDWVERAELGRAMDEMKLGGLGRMDRSEMIRGGHWINADWGVFGDISTNLNGARTLSLEVVNFQRADVLAATNLSLPSPRDEPFTLPPGSVSRVATALEALLDQARAVYLDSASEDTAALLFLSCAGGDDRYVNLEYDFCQALKTEDPGGRRFHLVQFQRPGAAMDEANLVLSGLAESDSNAWKNVADQYVWGNVQVQDDKDFSWTTHQTEDTYRLEAKLHIWGGQGEPQTIELWLTNATVNTLAGELARAAVPWLRRNEAKSAGDDWDRRARISESIDADYHGLPPFFDFDSPAGRQQWYDAVQTLETACFFNPGNAAAREQLLRLRWGTAVADTPTSGRHNEFFDARRRSDGWGKYVEQFGFHSALADTHSSSIAAEYVFSTGRVLEMFDFSQDTRTGLGMPTDAGLSAINQWQNQFGAELGARLVAAPEDPAVTPWKLGFFCHILEVPDPAIRTQLIKDYWPRILAQARQTPLPADACRHLLEMHFDEIGQSGGEEKLLAQLQAADDEAQARATATNHPAPAAAISLPRAADFGSGQNSNIFVMPPLVFLVPATAPEVQSISFPAAARVKGVAAMAFHHGILWLAVNLSEPVEVKAMNNQMEKEFQPVMVDHVRLWKLDTHTQTLTPVSGAPATNDISAMLLRGDTLWLALANREVARLDTKTEDWRPCQWAPGVTTTDVGGLAACSRGVVTMGGLSDLCLVAEGTTTLRTFLPGWPPQSNILAGSGSWLAGQGNQLLLFNSGLLLYDSIANAWTRLADDATLHAIGYIWSLAGDAEGDFWIAADSGLHQVVPGTGKIASQWVAVSPVIQATGEPLFPNAPPPPKTASELVREIHRQLQGRARFLAARKADSDLPNRFVPSSRLGSGIRTVAADGDLLWVFPADDTHPLLYDPASQKWVGGFDLQYPGTVSAEACGGGKLWLAAAQPDGSVAILALDTAGLKATPRDQWLPAAVSPTELSAQLAGFSEAQRAVYDFFAGDDAAVIRRLTARAEDQLAPESLFLLALAFEETGQTGPAGRLKQKLAADFSDSVYANYFAGEQRLVKVRALILRRIAADPAPPDTSARAIATWMIRTFDADGAGGLDEDELSIFFELEPEPASYLVFNPQPLKPAEAAADFLRRNDSNQDGRLEESELAWAVRILFLHPWKGGPAPPKHHLLNLSQPTHP